METLSKLGPLSLLFPLVTKWQTRCENVSPVVNSQQMAKCSLVRLVVYFSVMSAFTLYWCCCVPQFFSMCRPTERERTERLIKTRLREIMMQKDLENVTSKEVCVCVCAHTHRYVYLTCSLRQRGWRAEREAAVRCGWCMRMEWALFTAWPRSVLHYCPARLTQVTDVALSAARPLCLHQSHTHSLIHFYFLLPPPPLQPTLNPLNNTIDNEGIVHAFTRSLKTQWIFFSNFIWTLFLIVSQ